MTMTTEGHLRDALRTTYADDVQALPDVEGLMTRIDRHVRLARMRRVAFSGACLVLALVAGAGLLRAGPEGGSRLESNPVAAEGREPDPADHPELLPRPTLPPAEEPPPEPAPQSVQETPPPPPEPKPEPAPEPKPAAEEEPKPIEADTTPPPLHVTSPENGSHTTEPHATFIGETEPGAAVYTPEQQVEVDPSGRWEITLELAPGKNVKWFKAKDAAGNKTVVEVVVYYDPPGDQAVAFTAYQKFGTSSESPPYDVFYGTANSGSVVRITSDFGSAEVQAGADGQWKTKVSFEGAPPGVPFEVTVSCAQGNKSFTFTYKP